MSQFVEIEVFPSKLPNVFNAQLDTTKTRTRKVAPAGQGNKAYQSAKPTKQKIQSVEK